MLQHTQGFNADLKPRAVNTVEGEEIYKGKQRSAGKWNGPVSDKVRFGFSRALAMRGDVVPNIFDAVGNELAFLQLERDAIF
jgi:hypothetical protein